MMEYLGCEVGRSEFGCAVWGVGFGLWRMISGLGPSVLGTERCRAWCLQLERT